MGVRGKRFVVGGVLKRPKHAGEPPGGLKKRKTKNAKKKPHTPNAPGVPWRGEKTAQGCAWPEGAKENRDNLTGLLF